MKYLLDTCVISEVIKKKPSENVVTWLQLQDENDLYLSVLNFGEIEKGIEKSSDPNKKRKLRLWVENDLKKRFENRILPVDLNVVTHWGKVQGKSELSGRTMPSIDGLIAVTGIANNCIVVTRNVSDMEQSMAELFNPWDFEINS